MSVVNKVIVTSQLDTGDTIDVSVKAENRSLGNKDRADLNKRIQHSIIPKLEDTLYLKVRLTNNGKKDNWNKIKTVAELNDILDKIFNL